LAERIKSLRRAKGWSQEQLAERASMQRSYLADLECNAARSFPSNVSRCFPAGSSE
jgi:transcriptional regulator with XRE-family HTH domain